MLVKLLRPRFVRGVLVPAGMIGETEGMKPDFLVKVRWQRGLRFKKDNVEVTDVADALDAREFVVWEGGEA